MTASVIVLAHVEDEALRDEVGARMDALEAFYAPLGIASRERVWHPAARVLAGRIALGDASNADGRPARAATWTWGEPLPPSLASAEALFGADSDALRAIQGMTAAFAFAADRARIVSAPSGPATLYEASGDGIWCCSTHAVAAAWVALGDARVDIDAVPELLAFDFVGGRRTLVAGARHLPPATDVAIDAGGRRSGTWLSAAERWQSVPERDAQSHAGGALLQAVEERLRGRSASLALTAGLDSRVLAAALTEAGVPFDAFTWGAEGWPDTEGAALVARALGARHEILGEAQLPADAVLAEHDRAIRWADGVFALAASTRTWPAGAGAIAGGMGGETGRAFYYDAWSTWLWPDPPRAALADRLSGKVHLPAAAAEAAAQADAAVAGWLEEAELSGQRGWRLLDVAYADQRVRRWGRGQLPAVDGAFVPGFIPQELQRALVAQPLADRLGSAFHHRFLEQHRPDLAPFPEPPVSMPPTPLRAAHRLRDQRRRARSFGAPQHQPSDDFVQRLWAERPQARDWVLEHVLPHRLTGGRLGQAWIDWASEGFPRGAKRAGEHARLAAAVVALDDALAELRSSRRSSAP